MVRFLAVKTKQKILDAAVEILLESGFHAMTQTRIAQTAGVSQGNLTYHFPKKYDLLTAVVEECKSRVEAVISAPPKGEMTQEKFIAFLSGVALSKFMPRVMMALTMAVEDDPSLSIWFQNSEEKTRAKLRRAVNFLGWDVDDNALTKLRAAVIGVSNLHMQQNSAASEQAARDIIKMEVEYLIQNARPLQVEQVN
ncbi:Fatty acid metabolism regulator protein [Thalassocella blandensis]|nr:Fatty acid metabolism regulator protein [Thalassocella blandensis]